MLAKERPVLAPGFQRRLYERAAYRKKHLGGLADRLDYPVCRAPERQDGGRDRENQNRGGAAHSARNARRTGPEKRAKAVATTRMRIFGEGVLGVCERNMGQPISYPVKSRQRATYARKRCQREKLAADLRLVISDAKRCCARPSARRGKHRSSAREDAGEPRVGQTQAGAARRRSGEQVRSAVRAADDYVRANPWQAVGIAALAGIALGLLISRR